jgi:hypothetical protein
MMTTMTHFKSFKSIESSIYEHKKLTHNGLMEPPFPTTTTTEEIRYHYLLPRQVQPLLESSYAEGTRPNSVAVETTGERASLLPGLSPGYVWLCSHPTVVFKQRPLKV